MAQATKTRKPTEIQASTINRVSDKNGQFLGYLVKSNSSEDYYQVTYNASSTRYECQCAAFSKCCHIRAVEQVQAAKAEIAKQGNTSPAPTPEHRVSCVHGVAGACWYPEYNSNGTWYRFPQPDGGQAVSFVVKGRAEQWVAERIASVEESKAERKMSAFKRGMDKETAESNLRAYYNGL